jgi:hypothetical protein
MAISIIAELLSRVSFMLTVANKPFMLIVVMQNVAKTNVNMLSVVAP